MICDNKDCRKCLRSNNILLARTHYFHQKGTATDMSDNQNWSNMGDRIKGALSEALQSGDFNEKMQVLISAKIGTRIMKRRMILQMETGDRAPRDSNGNKRPKGAGGYRNRRPKDAGAHRSRRPKDNGGSVRKPKGSGSGRR